MDIRWDKEKDIYLKSTRGVSFSELLTGEIVASQDHKKYRHQKVLFVYYREYIWLVPFVKDDLGIFLKTLYPSRKYTKKYKRGEL